MASGPGRATRNNMIDVSNDETIPKRSTITRPSRTWEGKSRIEHEVSRDALDADPRRRGGLPHCTGDAFRRHDTPSPATRVDKYPVNVVA